MEKAKTTPKDFFLWAGAMIALYWSVISFVLLFFNYIDYALPDPLSYLGDPYSSGIPYEMASIVIVFPIFLVLMWLIHRDIQHHDASRKNIWVRRWALIFTLFVAGLAIVIDLVTLLTSFFRGEEFAEAFLLKVLIVLLVAGMVFMHFIADLWGYWEQYPRRGLSVLIGVLVLAVLSVGGGFLIVGTPQQARDYQLDEQRVTDLQSIESQIVSYYQAKGEVPASLSDLTNSISGFSVPTDPKTGQPYTYNVLGVRSFSLCANFSAPNQNTSDQSSSVPQPAASTVGFVPFFTSSDDWDHSAGNVCFERDIDPQLYPPLNKAP